MISNTFLAALSPTCRDLLAEHLTEIDLPSGTILYESGRVPPDAYFLTAGLASVTTRMSNGGTAEVGLIGGEGVVGGLHLLGHAPIKARCQMRLSGAGIKIPFARLQNAFDNSPTIRKRLLELVQVQALVTGQIAACNRLHETQQRLTCWLLLAKDLAGTETLDFTHEYLAEMVGASRSTISVIAGALKKNGCLGYTRGHIRSIDRKGLEAITCDCYRIISNLYSSLYAPELERQG